MSEQLPELKDAIALGLTEAEYELVCEKQGSPPNQVELAMYSLLWSEHCAYKHSKKLLVTLPTEGPAVVMGPGENAGAVDVGDGLICAFKVESHNHPSAVEPFQGAATGRSPCSTRCASVRLKPANARATCSSMPLQGSATTATRSAFLPLAERSTSKGLTSRTASSTRWLWGLARASG